MFNDDCFNVFHNIDDKSVDMILCDLPYGTTRNKWDIPLPFDKLWKEYERIIKDNGAIVLFSAEPFTSKLILSNEKLFRYDLIWHKPLGVGFLNANRMPLRNHENICVFYKKMPTYNPQFTYIDGEKERTVEYKRKQSPNYGKIATEGVRTITNKRNPTSIIFGHTNAGKKDHPTAKPVKLMEYLIKTYTNEGDIVLDNCAGTGATALAAIRTNRKALVIEREKEYFERLKEKVNNALQYSYI